MSQSKNSKGKDNLWHLQNALVMSIVKAATNRVNSQKRSRKSVVNSI